MSTVFAYSDFIASSVLLVNSPHSTSGYCQADGRVPRWIDEFVTKELIDVCYIHNPHYTHRITTQTQTIITPEKHGAHCEETSCFILKSAFHITQYLLPGAHSPTENIKGCDLYCCLRCTLQKLSAYTTTLSLIGWSYLHESCITIVGRPMRAVRDTIVCSSSAWCDEGF